MTTKNTVFELADKLEKTYSDDLFLGYLTWYAIPEDTKVRHSAFEQALEDNGVDFAKLPPAPRAVDVFKRGCTAAQRKKVEVDETIHQELDSFGESTDALHFNYLFRNAGQDADYVYRTLFREEVDSAGHEIGFTEIAKIRFTRSTSQITPTFGNLLTIELDIINDVRRYFTDNNDILTPYSLREFVRKTLEGPLHSVKVRQSGGVYFTQQAFNQNLDGLEAAVISVAGSGAFHTFPLIDDGKQREMLRTSFENETTETINTFVGEMIEITQSGKKITPEKYVDFRLKYNDLNQKLSEYAHLLDDALELSSARLDVMQAQIVNLMDYVDHGDD